MTSEGLRVPLLSSIMDGNSFRTDDAGSLSTRDRELIRRRARCLGPSYRLFYRRPVHAVRSEGCYIFDRDGRRYLDAYNNVAGVGHANKHVIDAVQRQMSLLNTHTRYLQEGVLEYSEQLLRTFSGALDTVMFTNSGSEANDLAIRMARLWTGGTGIVVTDEAYHGTTDLLSRMSPAISGGFHADPEVRTVPAPDTFRHDPAATGARLAAHVQAAFEDLVSSGVRPAAFLADSIFSSDGIYPDPSGFLRPVIDVVHAFGALFISDEVQPGFGRTGSHFWGYQRHGVEADLATLGKPMGNGIPISALVGRADIMAHFGERVPYFNTFGGNPVSIAAAQAVLDFIVRNGSQENARIVGARLKQEILRSCAEYDFIGDVRGTGLYIGVEVVTDGTEQRSDSARALQIVNELRERGVLISSAGPGNNVLKIRPPMVFGYAEVDLFATEFTAALAAVERQSVTARADEARRR